jgi:hypothetical protein
VNDTDREGYVTLARVGHAFAVVKAARALWVFQDHLALDPDEQALADAIADLDALDAANHREH